jgi:hypothetical protein
LFRGFDTTKSIVDLFEDEGSIKDLVDMLSSFILQVVKKDGNFYLNQPSTISNHFLNAYIILFFSFCVFHLFVLFMLFASYVFLFIIRFRVYV